MARHRSHSIEFKRHVAQEFIETLHGFAAHHGVSRNVIRVWVMKFEASAFDEDAEADLLQEYEAKIAALERMVGRQALKIEIMLLEYSARPASPRAIWWSREPIPPSSKRPPILSRTSRTQHHANPECG